MLVKAVEHRQEALAGHGERAVGAVHQQLVDQDVPADAVAVVDGEEIARSDYEAVGGVNFYTSGTLDLKNPKLRQGTYLPAVLEPRKTTEKALTAVIQEAWIGGVSTRRVDDLVQEPIAWPLC